MNRTHFEDAVGAVVIFAVLYLWMVV